MDATTHDSNPEAQLRAENAELRARLEEAEQTLRAIRSGEVDALIVETADGPQIFTLQGLDAESNRFRGEILAQVSDAVIAVDADHRVTYLNAAAERQYRVSTSDALGRPLGGIFTKQWPVAEAEAAMWAALRERGEWRGEVTHRTQDGRELQVESCLTLLRDAGIISAIRDITERKAAEQELARHRENLQRAVETRTAELATSTVALHTSERLAALGTLAAGLGHDIANLTMPIRTRLELLNAACTTDEAREDLAAIRKALDHLSNLSAGMRLMAIDPERGEASPPAADLESWCAETSQIFRAALPRQIQLKCDVPSGLGVNIPRHRLAQAVFNLVQNAGEAMAARPAGTVRVTAEAATSDAGAPVVKVQVSDDGPGMSAEVVARCFEPYFSTKGRAICTGMGLGMVRGIVDSAGGTVAVRSAPGEGTTFTLTLPAVVSGQAAHANAALMAAVTVKSQREAALAMMFLGQLKVRTSRHLEPSVPEVSLWVVERPDPALLRAYLGHDRERRVVVLDRGFDSAASDTGGQKPWDGQGLNDLNARMTVLSPSPSPGELRNAITQAIRASAPTALGT